MLLTLSDIVPKPGERACFFGKTGAGKTTLAKKLLITSAQPFVIIDNKHTTSIPNVPIRETFSNGENYQIVRPNVDKEVSETAHIVEMAWKRGNTIIYIDELTLANPQRTRLLPAFGRAIRTGRERKVSVWCGSQRPKDIPSNVFTETENFYIFRLVWDDDRKKVGSFTSNLMYKRQALLRGHDFLYYNVVSERHLYVKQDGGNPQFS
jgi:DNA helicase HerA-like ATPase